ncbi:MAG TPA: hypothetical protein VI078_10225 [bacterium]
MRAVVGCLALFAVMAVSLPPAPAAAGSVAQVYYVPLPEDQIHVALTGIFPGPAACGASQGLGVGDAIVTYLSLTPVAEGTVITYDHWEDGYEADIARPSQASTEVWGDGDPANGSAPGFPDDRIGAGGVIVLHNEVPAAGRGAILDYDGGDKLAASLPIAVTRAAWGTGTGTQLAGALEMRELRQWGRLFRAPVGQDVPGTQMFQLTSLLVMASRNGTSVAIDANADGTPETFATLDEGQSYQVPRGVLAGASVAASAPVQAALITGDVCATYQSRWFSLEPEGHWGPSAWAPVGTGAGHPTAVYVFNPGHAPVAVVRETLAGRDAGVVVAPRSVRAFAVPEASGARFASAGGEPILAVGTVDAGGSAYEWSFSLIQESLLTPQALVGWGAGRDPLSDVKPDENGSPVWVTPVLPGGRRGNVLVCVDYNGDNVGDLGGAGCRYDRQLDLRTFESFRVYDPDGDQTGMILYVCDDSGARLAVAWGQDPSAASTPQPGLDLGTTVPPLPAMAALKEVELALDADGDGLPGAGDTLRYTIRVRNVSRRPVTNLVVSDELPLHTNYVDGSTTVDAGGGPVALPDAGLTPFPLDEGGASLGTLDVGGAVAVVFLAVIDDPLPADVRTVLNVAVARSDLDEIEAQVELPLAPWRPRPSLALAKTAVVETVGSAGTGTIGYWKNHPEAWPVEAITAGGRSYPRDEAIRLMSRPGGGDKTYDLFRQFVAATLNGFVGNDTSCITAVLAAADRWLAAHPPGSGVRADDAAWTGAGAALHATLDAYNNGLLCAPHRDAAGAGGLRRDVVFTVTVTNDGNVDLDGVAVQDAAMPACSALVGTLPAFGGSAITTCRAEGVVADLTNVALAVGTAPDGSRVSARAEVFVDLPDGAPTPTRGVRTLAFWRRYPERWPVLKVALGAGAITREGVLRTLAGCAPGDVSCALYGQLAAARLNLLAGAAASCITRPVAAADAWLAAHPPGGGTRASSVAWRTGGRRQYDLLRRYNEGGLCAPPASP